MSSSNISGLSISGLSTFDLWQFVTTQTKAKESNKPLQSLDIPADEVQDLVGTVMRDQSLLDRAANHLASRIQAGKITFPNQALNKFFLHSLIQKLFSWWGRIDGDIPELIPSCKDDDGKSHVVLPASHERLAANHDYSKFWKPIIDPRYNMVAVILPNTLGLLPEELIDCCTCDRFLMPIAGWERELSRVCKAVLEGRVVRQNPAEALSEKDFREACIKEFPCAPHFPMTALKTIMGTLRNRSPETFKNGIRLLDTDAGYGHRLAAALCHDSVADYTASCDPSLLLQDGGINLKNNRYSKIFTGIREASPGLNDFELTIHSTTAYYATFNQLKRKYKIVGGKAEDPENMIYKVDTLYNLVFSMLTPNFTPILQNSWNVLSPGGYLTVYTSDEHTPDVVKALMDLVVTKFKGEYIGMIPCKSPLSQNRQQDLQDKKISVTGAFDPIWVFQKPN